MSDNTANTTPAVDMTQLLSLLQTVQNQSGTAPATVSGWGQQPQNALKFDGVNVPISLDTPMGKVRCYFQLGGEFADPQKLMQVLEQMANAGIPLDAWQSNSGGNNWGGNSGNSNGGGWKNRNSGGYNRGGNWR